VVPEGGLAERAQFDGWSLRCAVVGAVEDQGCPEHVARFVRKVEWFKELAVSGGLGSV